MNLFKYSYIQYIGHRYFSDIRFYQIFYTNIFWHSFVSFFLSEYIQTFVCECVRVWKLVKYLNIFKYSYNFQCECLFGHSFVSNLLYEYIRIFVCVNFLMRICSDTHLCRNVYECHTLIQMAEYTYGSLAGILSSRSLSWRQQTDGK